MSNEKFVIGNYTFENVYDYKAAQEDIKKIELINNELNIQDPEVAIRLYNDIRDGIITFNSPIGQQFADHVGDIVANKSADLLDSNAIIQDAEGQAKYNKVIGLFFILAAVVVFGIYGYGELSDYLSAKKMANLAQAMNNNNTNTSQDISKNDDLGLSSSDTQSDITNEGSDADVVPQEPIWPQNIDTASLSMLPEMEELYGKNSDVVGWLSIEGTKVNYPVMQTGEDDPSFYLRRDFDKADNSAGTLFMDFRSDFVNPTTNTIIYGHNMKNLSMFGTLKYYLEEDFYRDHKLIDFKTLYEERQYEIVAVGLSKVAEEGQDVTKYYNFIQAYDQADLDTFISEVEVQTVYDEPINVSQFDQLLTLSTCNAYTEDGRLFIVAKRIK